MPPCAPRAARVWRRCISRFWKTMASSAFNRRRNGQQNRAQGPASLDEKGRIMVIAVHNCDNGDGWEREGEDDYFFHEFSEKRAYPLGINIIFYLLTH